MVRPPDSTYMTKENTGGRIMVPPYLFNSLVSFSPADNLSNERPPVALVSPRRARRTERRHSGGVKEMQKDSGWGISPEECSRWGDMDVGKLRLSEKCCRMDSLAPFRFPALLACDGGFPGLVSPVRTVGTGAWRGGNSSSPRWVSLSTGTKGPFPRGKT